MRNQTLIGVAALSLALSACSLAPKYERPQVALPDGWSSVAGVGATQFNTIPFWQELGSADLNRLIENVLAQNLDLEAALQRIEQARATAKIAASALYPSINASGAASRIYQDPRDSNAARGGGSVSYEVDLWGKNRNQAESAGHRVDASRFDREALRLVITSDATNFYSQILSVNDRIRIAEFNLKNAEEILRIVEARFNAGSVSGLEVAQQRVAVNGFRTALASLIEQRSTTANALPASTFPSLNQTATLLLSLSTLRVGEVKKEQSEAEKKKKKRKRRSKTTGKKNSRPDWPVLQHALFILNSISKSTSAPL